MSDLYLALAGVSLLAGLCWGAGYRVARKTGGRTVAALIAAAITLVVAYTWLWHRRIAVAAWLPFSAVIVWGNLLPLAGGWVAGCVSGIVAVPRWRRALLSVLLLFGAAASLGQPMWRAPLPSRDVWTDGVCLQSNSASCSAAATATLLSEYGIEASAAEMIELCLTHSEGTPELGLYRGLKRKTARTVYDVQVFHGDLQALRKQNRWPVLLLVALPDSEDVDPRYERDWGWIPGVGHSVVVYGLVGDDRVAVGDPAVGRETWSIRDLEVLWTGDGLHLVER